MEAGEETKRKAAVKILEKLEAKEAESGLYSRIGWLCYFVGVMILFRPNKPEVPQLIDYLDIVLFFIVASLGIGGSCLNIQKRSLKKSLEELGYRQTN